MDGFREYLVEALSLKGDYKYGYYQRLVAAAYEIAPVFERTKEVIDGYKDLMQKLQKQYTFLQHDFEFVPDDKDHYTSMKHLTKEIDKQREEGERRAKMYVYSKPPQQGHPTLSNDENVLLRGVHDAITHYARQHPFSARGEYAAYSSHLKTLCNIGQAKSGQCPAAKVLFTEIVGQTSHYYVYKGYAIQKAAILKQFDHYNVGRLNQNSYLNEFFEYSGKSIVLRQGVDLHKLYRTPIGAEFGRQEIRAKSATQQAELSPEEQ